MKSTDMASRRAFSRALVVAIGVAAAGLGRVARAEEAPDGLVRVRRKNVTSAWLLPGADLRSYSKLRVQPGAVSYHPVWFRESNSAGGRAPEDRILPEEAEFILTDLQRAFEASFPAAVKVAGLDFAQAGERSVLLLRAAVVELWVSAPPRAITVRNVRTAERAGRGVLEAELVDSTTGKVLARFRDRRETPMGLAAKGPVTRELNEREFGLLFQRWAEVIAAEITELRALSPLPAQLEENQSFPAR